MKRIVIALSVSFACLTHAPGQDSALAFDGTGATPICDAQCAFYYAKQPI